MVFLCFILFGMICGAMNQSQLSIIFRDHNVLTVKILDFVGAKEFVKKIPSKAILVKVLQLYRYFIEMELVHKKELVSQVFFTPDSILELFKNSKTFQDEFERAKLQKGGYFDFFLAYLKENESHYTKNLSRYMGPNYQFPEKFVNEIKKYEQWERGINSPDVFRMVFYSACILAFELYGGHAEFWGSSLEASERFYAINRIPTLSAIFPAISDFLNRNGRAYYAISILVYIVGGVVGETFFKMEEYKFGTYLLLGVTAASMFQIFYVAQKRKNIEKFSKHQNATICFAKCVFLVIFQLVLGSVMSLIFPLWFYYFGNALIFHVYPNVAFKLANSISDASWRNLINNPMLGLGFLINNIPKNVVLLELGFFINNIPKVVMLGLGLVLGLGLGLKMLP